jgi:predicted SAM-dependent methyltransferase
MSKHNYLNIGCGNKYHKDWVNIDMVSSSKDIVAVNILKGLPFPDNSFDIIYHSQVLEHIPKENSGKFMNECFRVLKPGGIIRVVVPDLENIVDEYKRLLKMNAENPNELSEANYDWILLEMYDQTVRNHKGGLMAEYLRQPTLVNEKYVIDRIGYIGRSIRESFLKGNSSSENIKRAFSSVASFKFAIKYVLNSILDKFRSRKSRIGSFRLGGEIHMWMYDRFSLSRLLKNSGFVNISIKNPFVSEIPNWNSYELDVKEGLAYDPTSLFAEAKKV